MSNAPAVRMRNATRADLPSILRVEQSWPEAGRAGEDKFLSRLERFPRGFFVACLEEDGAEKIVGTITSMPLRYDPALADSFGDWDSVTRRGYLPGRIDLASCNALYIVSGVIDAAYRGLDIFRPGVMSEVGLARSLGLRYVLAGAVLPGFRAYCERHGETEAFRYCTARKGSQLVDPLLALYEKLGFRVPDARHVLPEYFPDDASRNHAALVRLDLQAAS